MSSPTFAAVPDGDIVLEVIGMTIPKPEGYQIPQLEADLKSWLKQIAALARAEHKKNNLLLARYLWAAVFQACCQNEDITNKYHSVQYEYNLALNLYEGGDKHRPYAMGLFTDIMNQCSELKAASKLDKDFMEVVGYVLECVHDYAQHFDNRDRLKDARELYEFGFERSCALLGWSHPMTTTFQTALDKLRDEMHTFSNAGDVGEPEEPESWINFRHVYAPKASEYGELFDTRIATSGITDLNEKSKNNLCKAHESLRKWHESAPYNPNDPKKRRIRIAVLDTGVDMQQAAMKEKSARIIDFFCPIDGHNANKDDCGHGTHVVSLLLQIAPEVDIYVARIFDNTRDVSSAMVVPAIRHASEVWDVDIITMSFGFQPVVPAIEAELKKLPEKVLLFAAASNDGANSAIQIAFPARLEDRVFCIFSTDISGNRSTFNPVTDIGRDNFATYGENVKAGGVTLSGTSMATPIAAGTAALLIDFSRLPILTSNIMHFDRVQTTVGMKELFRHFCKSNGSINFLKPWMVFQEDRYIRNNIAWTISKVLAGFYGTDEDS